VAVDVDVLIQQHLLDRLGVEWLKIEPVGGIKIG
jgi:hypothetical protein